MKENFKQHLKGIYRILKNRFDNINSSIAHSLTQGQENEEEIKKLLIDFLPPAYGIGTGIIIDTNGTSSKQIDIIIYDKTLPNYTLSSQSKIFLLDHVIATIEIKTNFTTGTDGSLINALENVKSVQELIPSNKTWVDLKSWVSDEQHQQMDISTYVPLSPISVIFFYQITELKSAINIDNFYTTIKNALLLYDKKHHPDVIFSLGHASMVNYTDPMKKIEAPEFNTFLLNIDDGSKRPLSISNNISKSVLGIINYGNVKFVHDSQIDIDTIHDDKNNPRYYALKGNEINLEPEVYKSCIIDNKSLFLDEHRAFLVFIYGFELILRTKKTNKNLFLTDYFSKDFFYSYTPKIKYGT